MAIIIRKTAKRDYSVDGFGPSSKAVEIRNVRSAVTQANRDAISEAWKVTDESKAMKLITTIRVITLEGGVRRIAVETILRNAWVEDIDGESE